MYIMLVDTVTTSLGKDIRVFSQWWGEVREKKEIPLLKKSNRFKISFKLSPTDKCVEKSDAREWLRVWWEQAVGRRKNNVSPLLHPPPHLTG